MHELNFCVVVVFLIYFVLYVGIIVQHNDSCFVESMSLASYVGPLHICRTENVMLELGIL